MLLVVTTAGQTVFMPASDDDGVLTEQAGEGSKRIACVGDSITYGYLMEQFSYPKQLQEKLGSSQYQVLNFGVGGSTAQKNGDLPYINQQAYKDAQASNPDIVLLMLGTNDSKPQNWNQDNYSKDYADLALSFVNLASKPKVYVMIPPPVYYDNFGI